MHIGNLRRVCRHVLLRLSGLVLGFVNQRDDFHVYWAAQEAQSSLR